MINQTPRPTNSEKPIEQKPTTTEEQINLATSKGLQVPNLLVIHEGPCNGGDCPKVFMGSDGDIYLQSYETTTPGQIQQVPVGEILSRWPREFFESLKQAILEGRL